jgi:predicted ATPase
MPLVGRQRHLDALGEAFRAVHQGRTVLMYVHGRSGMGKSALLEHYLDVLNQQQSASVLIGRCYEQESVPFRRWIVWLIR